MGRIIAAALVALTIALAMALASGTQVGAGQPPPCLCAAARAECDDFCAAHGGTESFDCRPAEHKAFCFCNDGTNTTIDC